MGWKFLSQKRLKALYGWGPSPDDFTLEFWAFNWYLVREEIMICFEEFHLSGRLVKCLNIIFLVLRLIYNCCLIFL